MLSATVHGATAKGDEMPQTTRSAGADITRIAAAEFFGTMVLMLIGPGSAILAANVIGVSGVALAFGFALLIMAYAIGGVSGCHINPAVTLAFVVSGKLPVARALYYWVAQIAGGIAGGLLLFIITEGGKSAADGDTKHLDQTGIFAANGWGDKIGSGFGLGAVIVVEIVFTALLIFVVLSTTTDSFPAGFGGLAAGLTLAAIHLATIPVDNTSVNPARSIGAAVFSGGDAMSQIWAFIVWPLVGGLVGAFVWAYIHNSRVDLNSLKG
jgi:aquaporin Z